MRSHGASPGHHCCPDSLIFVQMGPAVVRHTGFGETAARTDITVDPPLGLVGMAHYEGEFAVHGRESSFIRDFMQFLDFLGERPLVDFCRAVIDSEGSHFAEHLFNNGIAAEAGTTHHLHTIVGNAEQGF